MAFFLLAAPCVAVAAFAALEGCGRAGPGPEPTDTGVTARRTFEGFYRPSKDRVPRDAVKNPGTPWGDWVGSEACRECHRDEYERWRGSFHSRTLYVANEKTVFGDFSGKKTLGPSEHAFTATPSTSGDRFQMTIGRSPDSEEKGDTYGQGVPRSPLGTYEVLYAFGNRRDQPYVARAGDGRHWVLPAAWDDRKHEFVWDGWRPYVVACAGCHVTGIRVTRRPGLRQDWMGNTPDPDVDPKGTRWNVAAQDEGWADGAVGCEACHGPAKGHVETVRRQGVEAYRAYLSAGGAPTIYNPKRDTGERRMQQCDTCHTFFTDSPVLFVPGPNGYDRDAHTDKERLSVPNPKTQKDMFNDMAYWPDGTSRSACTAGLRLRESRMGKKGVECRDCHDPHGTAQWAELTQPNEKNQVCLRCHQNDAGGRFADAKALVAHTRHAADSPGSLCAECHMPRDKSFTSGARDHGELQFMSRNLHSHAMSVPTGFESDRGGPPSACNTCHVDRDAEWTRAQLRSMFRGQTAKPGEPGTPK